LKILDREVVYPLGERGGLHHKGMVGTHPYLVEIMILVVLMGVIGIMRSPYTKAMQKGINQMKVYLPNITQLVYLLLDRTCLPFWMHIEGTLIL
jgi:hypothetical protein